jgi:hypothetical protein
MNRLTFNCPVVHCCKKRRVQRFPDEKQPLENNKELWGSIGKFLFNDHSEVQKSSAQRVSGAYDRFRDPTFHGRVWDDILSGIVLQDDQQNFISKKMGLNSYRPVGVSYYIGDNKDFKNHQNNFRPYGNWGLQIHKDPNILVAIRYPCGKINLSYMGLEIEISSEPISSFEEFEQIINSGSFSLTSSTDSTNIDIKIDPAYIDHILLDCNAVEDKGRGISKCYLFRFFKPSEYSYLSRGKKKTS